MPYRILCNGVKREGVKVSPDLASGLFCYVPLHNIRDGIYMVMRTQIEQERKAYEKIPSGREVQLNKLVQSTANIYGTMQGILAESMPQIKGFDVLEIESGNA